MAQADCIPSMKLDVGEVKMMESEDSCPPSKKMKQGRLPFKPLEHTGQKLQGNTPPGSKKRKLSDNESPSAKQLKTSSVPTNTRTPITDGEPEVSSSSEADVVSDHLQCRKLNTLDKFFKPKAYTQDQEEISSTNECIEIDLTDENSRDKDEQVETGKSESADTENKQVGDDKTKVATKAIDKSADVNEDKENKSDSEIDDANSSFIDNTSVCEDALKTPAKGKLPESILKTPVVSAGASNATTPSQVGTPSQGSASDSNTPVSGKKRSSVLSESKKKERDLQRQKVKEEKERQKEELRLQKEKEREEKKKELMEKKKQKEEQKEKERLEKEKLKQEEKDKKEKERLDKLKQKEDEKKQKEKENEAKLEEKRKKDEDRKQKEEERKQKEEEKRKEEEEKQRKQEKKKEMFKGFFIKKDPVVSPPKQKEIKNGLFMPFELKLNMKLAPERRANPLSTEARDSFDEEFNKQESHHLYLEQIKMSSFTPGHCKETWPRELDADNDVEFLSHEKETIEKVTHHVKFLYFHENNRPPYYGTWRKRSRVLTGRNPFKQDEKLFDYEVDSDDEWEEEEPGESVSSDEEEEEGEKVEDEDPDADDWMVPHGYLSDGEGVDEDEEVDTASKQDLQKVRQAAWESELKRQAKPLKMLAIGCTWENDETTTIAAKQLETLLKYKAVCLTEGPIGTTYTAIRTSEVDTCTKSEKTEEKKNSQRKSVPEEAIPDLIRLIHGSPVGIKNLIKEFRMFWKKKTNPSSTDDPANSTLDSSKLDMSMEVDDKAEKPDTPKSEVTENAKSLNESKAEVQEEFAISKRQLELKIPSIAVREKRADHKKVCWYVKEEILKQYDMTGIKLPNSWEYVCIKQPTWAQEKVPTPKVEEIVSAPTTGRATPNIMQFAQPMSPSQIQALGPAIKETSKTAENVVAVTEKEPVGTSAVTPGKPTAPSDQKRIMDMFSPAARKTVGNKLNKNIGSPKLIGILSSPNSQTSPGSKLSINSIAAKLSGSPKATEVRSEKSEKTVLDTAPKQTKMSPETSLGKTTPKAMRPKSVLQSMLSSPELMKATSTGNTEETKESEKEQPMDVDIIVLD